jgi:hypothetical protein
MAITYAYTTPTQTYAGIIAIARAKLDELSDESFLTTRPGVMGTDNALYLDLVKEEFYFGDFSVDGAVVFDQGQVRSLMVSLAEMVDRSTKTHELRQIVDTSIANAIARHYDTGKCDTATQYMVTRLPEDLDIEVLTGMLNNYSSFGWASEFGTVISVLTVLAKDREETCPLVRQALNGAHAAMASYSFDQPDQVAKITRGLDPDALLSLYDDLSDSPVVHLVTNEAVRQLSSDKFAPAAWCDTLITNLLERGELGIIRDTPWGQALHLSILKSEVGISNLMRRMFKLKFRAEAIADQSRHAAYMELWGNPGICVEPRRKADKSDYIARCDVCTLTSRRPDLVELLAE